MKVWRIAITALLASLLWAYPAQAEEKCAHLYQEHLKTDLSLTREQFDQDMEGGFRKLAHQGCEKEAADLIVEYIRVRQDADLVLRWHVAQLRGITGDTQAAIEYGKASVDPKADPIRSGRWNDYVLATVAFWERDKEKLVQHRNLLAEVKDMYWGNALNLRLVDNLISQFDRDYGYIMDHLAGEILPPDETPRS